MTFKSRNAAISLLAFVVIAAIIGATDAKRPTRIVGGQLAQLGEFKWMVSFTSRRNRSLCGGAIIAPRYILTAAHCFDGLRARNLIVKSGIVDLRDSNVIESRIARVVNHPNYLSHIPDVRELENDISIVMLDRDLDLGGRLRAIRLPTQQPGRQRAMFCGWGDVREVPKLAPKRLQKTEVQVIDDDECKKMGVEPMRPQYFCGHQEQGNLLDGDSGGPLTSNGEIIGVASSGFGLTGVSDSFTNVYHYLDWINSVINEPLD